MLLLYFVGAFLASLLGTAVGATNEGTWFVFAFISNKGQTDGVNQIIIRSNEPSNVKINIPFQNTEVEVGMAANSMHTHSLGGSHRLANGKEKKGIFLTADKPVTVQIVSAEYDSADALIALPVSSQNTDFLIPSFNAGTSGQNSLIGVVGTEAGTSVTVYSKDNAVIATVSLDAYETYQLLSPGGDFSGARVVSDRPVSVFSGNDYTTVPQPLCCADHLAVQVPPTSTLGTQFMLAPISGRNSVGYLIRVIAQIDNTNVVCSANGATVTLQQGESYDVEVSTMTGSFVECSQACLVVQYNLGSQADFTQTDPFMMLVPSTNQYSNNFAVSTAVRYDFEEFDNYVSVIAENTVTGGILLDNNAIQSSWTAISGTNYATTGFKIQPGRHKIHHQDANVRFTGFVYGHASVHTEGYGHELGYGNL